MITRTQRARVTVAVLTFKRPKDIVEVVPQLLEQAAHAGADYDVEVLVVDNDPLAGAQTLVDVDASPGRLRYVFEARPGISAARNRVLDEASASDVLVFIDDDERPHQGWLAALLQTWRSYECDAVAGRVESRFLGHVDPWISAGGFLARAHRAGLSTGTVVPDAATNNLLVDLRIVRRLQLRFDDDFGLTGGEDSLFTRRLTAGGGYIVWCAEAVVTDEVPAARANRRWVIARAMSHGNTAGRVELALASDGSARLRRRLACFGRGLARLLLGSLRTMAGTATRSPKHQAGGLRTAARGAGLMLSAAGYAYREYSRPS